MKKQDKLLESFGEYRLKDENRKKVMGGSYEECCTEICISTNNEYSSDEFIMCDD